MAASVVGDLQCLMDERSARAKGSWITNPVCESNPLPVTGAALDARPAPKPMAAPPPPLPPRPIQKPRSASRFRVCIGAAALLGWMFFAIGIAIVVQHVNSAYNAPRTAVPVPVDDGPLPCNVLPLEKWPEDDLASLLQYPSSACYQKDATARLEQWYQPLYPLTYDLLAPKQKPAAIAPDANSKEYLPDLNGTCYDAPNLAEVFYQMLERKTPLAVSFKTYNGSYTVNLARLRYSLQQHIQTLDEDFMCAQHVGVPLCYCVWKRTLTREKDQWVDLIGKLNITLTSSSTLGTITSPDLICGRAALSVKPVQPGEDTMNDSDKGPSPVYSMRFKHIWIQYATPWQWVAEHAVSGKSAMLMQHIFELQRGMTRCRSGMAEGQEALTRMWQVIRREHVNRDSG